MNILTNPVYKRETMVSARSFRLVLVLMVFNGILALVALLYMYSTLAQVRVTAEIRYGSFLEMYMFVAALEFCMLVLIMPAITAGSISGERERRTLDLMMSTKMMPMQIVAGKLAASLSTMVLLIVSSFPILALVFVYGGVTMKDIGMMLMCFGAAALFVGSLGVCCSALCRKSSLSTVMAYVLTGVVVVGTYGINQLALFLGRVPETYFASTNGTGGTGSSGGFIYLLLVNPTASFFLAILRLSGKDQAGDAITRWFGVHRESFVSRNWIGCSVALQVLMAAVLVWVAVRALSPGRKRKQGIFF